jgi:hypothetical protein
MRREHGNKGTKQQKEGMSQTHFRLVPYSLVLSFPVFYPLMNCTSRVI